MPTPTSTRDEWFLWLVDRPAKIVLTVILAVVVRWFLHRLIDRIAKRAAEGKVPAALASSRTIGLWRELSSGNDNRRGQRARTLASLLKSVVSAVVLVVALVMVLDLLGLPITPVLTGAGVIGVAIGFGAQTLVKDFLSGIFMILEDQYGVGDSVDLGPAKGTVEAVGLRVTQLRDSSGTVWYVRNGEILRVGNRSMQWVRSVVDVTVKQHEDAEAAQRLLGEVVEELRASERFAEAMVREPEVLGVQRVEAGGVVLRTVVTTTPGSRTAVTRALQTRVLDAFAAAGIPLTAVDSPGG